MRRKLLGLAIGMLLLSYAAVPAGAATPGLGIDVLSNRADVISAGDALVEVKVPAGVDPAKVKVFDDSRDVTSSFAPRLNQRFEGLVTGLSLGRNVLTASAPGANEREHRRHRPPERRAGLLGATGPALGLPVRRRRRPVQPARELRVSVQVDGDRRSSPPTTRRARRPTSPRRRPTRA